MAVLLKTCEGFVFAHGCKYVWWAGTFFLKQKFEFAREKKFQWGTHTGEKDLWRQLVRQQQQQRGFCHAHMA